MHSKGQLFISLFRAIVFGGNRCIDDHAGAVLPAYAQNSVPPTAVQAAKMPQFASRLAIQPSDCRRPSLQRLRAQSRIAARSTATTSTTTAPSTATPTPGRSTSDSSPAIPSTRGRPDRRHRHDLRRLAVSRRHRDLGRDLHHLRRKRRHQLLRSDGELHPGILHRQ